MLPEPHSACVASLSSVLVALCPEKPLGHISPGLHLVGLSQRYAVKEHVAIVSRVSRGPRKRERERVSSIEREEAPTESIKGNRTGWSSPQSGGCYENRVQKHTRLPIREARCSRRPCSRGEGGWPVRHSTLTPQE